MKERRLIVASASPRRRELLAQAGFVFQVEPSDADETLPDTVTPASAVEQLAARKAQSVAEKHPTDVVLGCDTIVALGDEKLGKPQTAADAKAMLQRLSGKTHTVYTGVCIDTSSTLGICAERNAIFNMITNGEQEIEKVIAILPDGSSGAPCGACRELMVQLMPEKYKGIQIMMDYGKERVITLGELTPEWWIR